MTIWELLATKLHPADCPPPDSWRPSYETKYALLRLLAPQSIIEFGVRAGYSAFVFLQARPGARYLGIDANRNSSGGFVGAVDHARTILRGFDASVAQMTTAEFAELYDEDAPFPRTDLVHVDGDHSLEGCAFDLDLALRLEPQHILADDYLEVQGVRSACDEFFKQHADQFSRLVIADGHNGCVVFSRIASVIQHARNSPR